jgi:cytochrome P450
VATRGEDIYEIFKDHERFSSRQLVVPKHHNAPVPLPPIMFDPPEQAKYRSLLRRRCRPRPWRRWARGRARWRSS